MKKIDCLDRACARNLFVYIIYSSLYFRKEERAAFPMMKVMGFCSPRHFMKWNIQEDRPIWIQLKEQLGRKIISGEYKGGDKLPSVRELAKEAGVNPNTMQRALSALDEEGLTRTNRTSGRVVSDDPKKAEQFRKEIAAEIIENCKKKLQELGYSPEEIKNLLIL